jgi:hypothetical protein
LNKRNRRVLLGYMALSDAERQELDPEIEKFRRSNVLQRKDLRESHQRSDSMDLGPVGTGPLRLLRLIAANTRARQPSKRLNRKGTREGAFARCKLVASGPIKSGGR